MKKSIVFPLVSLSLLLGLSNINKGEFSMAKAEDDITYVDIGPALVNENANPDDLSRTDPNNYGLAYRGAPGDYWLMLYPSDNSYAGIPFNQSVSADQMKDSDFDKIKIYTDETHYFTAKEAMEATGRSPAFNIFSDVCLNISIPISGYNETELDKILQISVEKDFQYPYGTTQTKYVQEKTRTYKNPNYGNEAVKQIPYHGSWLFVKSLDGSTEEIDISACTRTDQNGMYKIHIRDQFFDPETYSSVDDSGACSILFLFEKGTYNPSISGQYNVGIAGDYLDQYNFLDKIKFVLSSDGSTKTFREITEGKNSFYYNLWGETACLGARIGNYDNPSAENYNGQSFKEIIIEAGCEFPAYETTNGTSETVIKYVQTDTIILSTSAINQAGWALWWTPNFLLGNVSLSGVKVFDATETLSNGETINSAFVSLSFPDANYDGVGKKECDYFTQGFVRFLYVNGKCLSSINTDGTVCFFNLKENNTICFSVNGLSASEITEVIVKKGCSAPAYSASGGSAKTYGESSYYNVVGSSSYTLDTNSNTFVKDGTLYWTLWFDGENPIRVENNDYFDIDDAPMGKETENKKFLYWTDIYGLQVRGLIKVTTSIEFTGRYEIFHTVKAIIDGKESSYKISHNHRLTSIDFPTIPTKKGYAFVMWIDEDGNEYNIDNKVTQDMTITAVFMEDPNYPQIEEPNKGCGGSIIATSSLIALVSILGFSFFGIKKKY